MKHIVHRDYQLTRQQLLLMRSTLLEKCEEIMSKNQWPFMMNNLTTNKIFEDLRNYYNGINENPGFARA